MRKIKLAGALLLLVNGAFATPDTTQLAVWANEAIVATYSYDYKNYLPRQREIAKYFSAEGWIAYSKALNSSGLPAAVEKNAYFVSAVATFPPKVENVAASKWQATMPLLVIYKNPQYQQQQSLEVKITFNEAPEGQGVRGLSIESLQTKVIKPPCECQKPTNKDDAKSSPSAAVTKTVKDQESH